ncbi:unnamed protein product [Eruca vesicaria subsp. sativa]|uniref:CAAX prenyl protease 2/Lysostaphin resistance protein A-like domain-containing protein n=1 Tax=Eruca vesicaria subsp. sativa TaxID=29727 RepID=A0ABC8LYN9_ERUVS|nr:unnamed protein product [Eruca vesicaria subsp. sativa]
MVSQIVSCLSNSSSPFCISGSRSLIPLKTYNCAGLNRFSPGFANRRLSTVSRRKWRPASIFNSGKEPGGDGKLQGGGRSDWAILERWEVPWEWQTVSLTSFACVLSFVLTGLTEMAALPYLGIDVEKLSLDEKAEILFLDQGITTAVILAVIFTVAKTFEPLPDDIFRYGTYSLMQLLPLIGSSNISTLSLVGITGILAPLLEETVFRGFFMVSLTKWTPTPIAIIISSAAFALAHLTPGEFPQLFILGSVLGLTYAQTRNLITPMVIHGFWNSGVILLLTFLQVQGYDIKELLQAS